jgi:hypothetical protein
MLPVTSGQIAEQVGCHRDEISNALRSLDIQPLGRAGIVRLFAPGVAEEIRAYLERKRQRKLDRKELIS